MERGFDGIRVKLPREVLDCLIFATFKQISDRDGDIFGEVTESVSEKSKSRRIMKSFRRFSGDSGNEKPKSRRFREIFRDSGDLRWILRVQGDFQGFRGSSVDSQGCHTSLKNKSDKEKVLLKGVTFTAIYASRQVYSGCS
jgi:hypothetical protein